MKKYGCFCLIFRRCFDAVQSIKIDLVYLFYKRIHRIHILIRKTPRSACHTVRVSLLPLHVLLCESKDDQMRYPENSCSNISILSIRNSEGHSLLFLRPQCIVEHVFSKSQSPRERKQAFDSLKLYSRQFQLRQCL